MGAAKAGQQDGQSQERPKPCSEHAVNGDWQNAPSRQRHVRSLAHCGGTSMQRFFTMSAEYSMHTWPCRQTLQSGTSSQSAGLTQGP